MPLGPAPIPRPCAGRAWRHWPHSRFGLARRSGLPTWRPPCCGACRWKAAACVCAAACCSPRRWFLAADRGMKDAAAQRMCWVRHLFDSCTPGNAQNATRWRGNWTTMAVATPFPLRAPASASKTVGLAAPCVGDFLYSGTASCRGKMFSKKNAQLKCRSDDSYDRVGGLKFRGLCVIKTSRSASVITSRAPAHCQVPAGVSRGELCDQQLCAIYRSMVVANQWVALGNRPDEACSISSLAAA